MDCRFLSIDEVLDSFYIVPDFQRDYVWQGEHVETLLDDMKNRIESEENTPALSEDRYFIGSIVVFKDPSDGKFMLIDGQQRLTTLFLLLCGIKECLITKGDAVPQNISQSLQSITSDSDGGDVTNFRLELNYEKNQELLKLAFDSKLRKLQQTFVNKSQQNIIKAYERIVGYLDANFSNGNELKKFATDVRSRVGLVRIEADDLNKAMIVFETLNHRGVGLDAFDLLKNFLYTRSMSDKEYDELTRVWAVVKENLSLKSIRPLRFLRYFIVSIDDQRSGKPPTERGAFSWFLEGDHQKRFKIDEQPVAFARRIRDSSAFYRNMLFENKNHLGQPSMALDSLNELAGASTRQHMALLLTASEMQCPAEHFEMLVTSMESALFYSFMTKQRSQELEQRVADLVVALRKVNVSELVSMKDFIVQIRSKMSDREELFYNDFEGFGQHVVSQKYRQRYILAKYLLHSERHNKAFSYQLSSLMNDSTLEIEHVFAQNPLEETRSEFLERHQFDMEEEEEDYVIQRSISLFGNLLLMEGNLQKAASNKPYSEKRKFYENSKFWMVKKFTTSNPNATKQLMDSLKPWPSHDSWTRSELLRRQKEYGVIAKQIWNYGLE